MLATLLTDFGARDYFVGAMKGALLAVSPHAQVVDLTHKIAPHDIAEGAFTLLNAYHTFPPQTVHVAVVDPGVGSMRRPLLVSARSFYFVGPDNGLLSYVCEREGEVRVFHLTNEKYFRPAVSRTFHGRDIFAPVAGALLNGVPPADLGVQITDFVRLAPLTPTPVDNDTILAAIIHIDRFGNCITNITRAELPDEIITRGIVIQVGAHYVRSFRRFFTEGSFGPREIFALWGSAGFLEIAAARDSAARLLGVQRGQQVVLVTRKS
ncbi:MAG: S-adenosyl-l-methionine hydroxide adenosyltransferase family protein [Pyrinomonadaceae bacterium]